MKNTDDLISVCIVWGDSTSEQHVDNIINLSKRCSLRYEYFEILLLIGQSDYKNFSDELDDIENLRLIILRTPANHYEKRSICARESIGDIIIISTINEIEYFDFNQLINLALSDDCIVISKRESLAFTEVLFSFFFFFLGKVVGLEINLGLSRTIVFPRTSLNLILSQEYVDLKLRFPPSDIDFKMKTIDPMQTIKRSYTDMESKFSLMYMLLLNLTPTLLKQLTLFSGAGIFFSFSYFIYAIAIFLFAKDIQTGWFTLSLAISGTALFLTTSIFILSIGIQHMIANFSNKNLNNILYEVDSVNLYKNAEKNLNIEVNHKNESVKG